MAADAGLGHPAAFQTVVNRAGVIARGHLAEQFAGDGALHPAVLLEELTALQRRSDAAFVAQAWTSDKDV